eukprot:10748369-Alexandrium_andersonii.AAC.1
MGQRPPCATLVTNAARASNWPAAPPEVGAPPVAEQWLIEELRVGQPRPNEPRLLVVVDAPSARPPSRDWARSVDVIVTGEPAPDDGPAELFNPRGATTYLHVPSEVASLTAPRTWQHAPAPDAGDAAVAPMELLVPDTLDGIMARAREGIAGVLCGALEAGLPSSASEVQSRRESVACASEARLALELADLGVSPTQASADADLEAALALYGSDSFSEDPVAAVADQYHCWQIQKTPNIFRMAPNSADNCIAQLSAA